MVAMVVIVSSSNGSKYDEDDCLYSTGCHIVEHFLYHCGI